MTIEWNLFGNFEICFWQNSRILSNSFVEIIDDSQIVFFELVDKDMNLPAYSGPSNEDDIHKKWVNYHWKVRL